MSVNTVDRAKLKQLLINEFKKQKTDPPQWIDWMTIVVQERIEREFERHIYLTKNKKRQIIMEAVQDAVMWYIDTLDMIETTQAELQELEERRQRA